MSMPLWTGAPLGGVKLLLGVLYPELHIRHPTTGKPICNTLSLILIPVGIVDISDPLMHPACITAWDTYWKSQMPNG
jgi:hypothetical protein